MDEVKADAKPGGKYKIAMKAVERGKVFTTFGSYKEMIPGRGRF